MQQKTGYVLVWCRAAALAAVLVAAAPQAGAKGPDGRLTVEVVDQKSGEPIPARIRLEDSRGRPVRVPHQVMVSGGAVAFEGPLELPLRRGQYTFVIDAGPEFETQTGNFTIDRNAEDTKQVPLRRHVDMNGEGWWAGDLDCQVPTTAMPDWMRASGLNLVPLLATQNIDGDCDGTKLGDKAQESGVRFFGPWSSLAFYRGSGLLATGADGSFDLCRYKAGDPSVDVLDGAKEAGADVLALSADAWDLPLWLAGEKLTAVGVIHRGMGPKALPKDERGRPAPAMLYPGKEGPGRWSQAIYYHILNCGLRVPPFGASGSGSWKRPADNPLPGDGRTYVYCGDDFSRENWWEGLRAGRVVVTNGPLLRAQVEGWMPGHYFQLDQGQRRSFQIGLSLTFYHESPVEYLEVVRNGRVEFEVPLRDLIANKGQLPPLEFSGSGWFLVRAVTTDTRRYCYATTGPFYVVSGYRPRVSRASVEFFLGWLDELAERYKDDARSAAAVEAARPFWQGLLERADVE